MKEKWLYKVRDMPGLGWLQSYVYEIDVPSVTMHGIYFLYQDDVLVYVGKSNSVISRLCEHEKSKDFNKAYFLPGGKLKHNEILELENMFIGFCSPPLNGTHGTRDTQIKDFKKYLERMSKQDVLWDNSDLKKFNEESELFNLRAEKRAIVKFIEKEKRLIAKEKNKLERERIEKERVLRNSIASLTGRRKTIKNQVDELKKEIESLSRAKQKIVNELDKIKEEKLNFEKKNKLINTRFRIRNNPPSIANQIEITSGNYVRAPWKTT